MSITFSFCAALGSALRHRRQLRLGGQAAKDAVEHGGEGFGIDVADHHHAQRSPWQRCAS